MANVKVVCYGDVETISKTKALKLYKMALRCCDGFERQRYTNVIADLEDGRPLAWDGEEIPKGFHTCKYCYGLTFGDEEDRLCEDCRYVFGHSLYSEL